jgi:lysyl-tRNA synthetase class 1
MSDLRDLAMSARAWPFEEARKLLERFKAAPAFAKASAGSAKAGEGGPAGAPPEKGYVLFETGYGPSGLPHIGTFGEVVRTTMVRHAFGLMSDWPTRLFAFSDDMDGLRRVPESVPAKSQAFLYRCTDQSPDIGGVPLTDIPDPYGDCHDSYGAHNNAKLHKFLDDFGFDYEFQSATANYRSGRFDDALRKVLAHYDELLDMAIRTVRPERQRNYGLFLPLVEDKELGRSRYLYVRPEEVRPDAGTIVFRHPDGRLIEQEVTGGKCKLLWRMDWAMRWVALGVDYEMSGKDLIDSVTLSSRLCRILGGTPPESFTYELFLDEKGEKISKSKGNGLTVDEWLRYAPAESLSLFMYHAPKRAKRLYFDVIPRQVDDYLTLLEEYETEDEPARLENPVWHIHAGAPPKAEAHLSFSVLLNLASVCNTEDRSVLWGFITRYAPKASPQSAPILDRLVGHAIAYYRDFVKPEKLYRAPEPFERAALADLASALERLGPGADAEAIQTEIYEVGKRHPFADLRTWFQALYEILLGQPRGPRMGSFVALYGVPETLALVRRVLAGEDLAAG